MIFAIIVGFILYVFLVLWIGTLCDQVDLLEDRVNYLMERMR